MKTRSEHRPISFLRKHGDLEWLATKACVGCGRTGRLIFGMHPREQVRCLECGKQFRIKGRKR